jgi:hypothetical protein
LVGGYGHREWVEYEVVRADAVVRSAFHDPFRDGQTSLGGIRDAGFVEREAYDEAAVFFHQRKDCVHASVAAVDGVDHGLAAVRAHGARHRGGVGCIKLQRQGAHALQFANAGFKHFGLVDLGQAHVHVEYVRARLLLGDALFENITDVPLAQRLLETLFTGGVDPLADEHGRAAEWNGAVEGADNASLFVRERDGGHTARPVDQRRDVIRVCAAAAADDARTVRDDLFHKGCKLLHVHVEYGFSVFNARHPGVGLDQYGYGRARGKARQQFEHPLGAEAAVEADGVRAEALEHGDHCLGTCAAEHPAALVICAAHEHRKTAILFDGEHGGLGLIAIVHGFDADQIGARIRPRAHDLCEERHHLFKGDIPQRREHFAQRPDIQRDKAVCLPAARFVARFFGAFHRGGNDLPHGGVPVFSVELERVRAQRVGEDGVAARLEISSVQGGDLIGAGEVPAFRQLAGLQAPLLQNGAERTVQIENAAADAFHDRHRFFKLLKAEALDGNFLAAARTFS